jgi:hypothetical protein
MARAPRAEDCGDQTRSALGPRSSSPPRVAIRSAGKQGATDQHLLRAGVRYQQDRSNLAGSVRGARNPCPRPHPGDRPATSLLCSSLAPTHARDLELARQAGTNGLLRNHHPYDLHHERPARSQRAMPRCRGLREVKGLVDILLGGTIAAQRPGCTPFCKPTTAGLRKWDDICSARSSWGEGSRYAAFPPMPNRAVAMAPPSTCAILPSMV